MRIVKPSLQLILEVMDIHLRIFESFPPQIQVTVTGAVPSRGWSHPQLLPYTYVQPPPDGIYDYDFVAAPPRDVAAQVLTRITATVQGLPHGAKGIRVHASRNSQEALISPHDSACPEAGPAMGEGMLVVSG
jgi:hypothetical protein